MTMLVAVDISGRLQAGEITPDEVIPTIIAGILGGEKGSKIRNQQTKHIELMNSSGKSFKELYGSQSKDTENTKKTLNLTENIIFEAIKARASDLLIDPAGNAEYSVRFRVDGFLRTQSKMNAEISVAVINSIKAISDMDIAEKRRPQDGSFMARTRDASIYFRVATAGVMGGEKITIRLLNQTEGMISLQDVGATDSHLEILANAIRQPSGMIVVCGPTGSGKTVCMNSFILSILFRSTPRDVRFVLIDPKMVELSSFSDIPHLLAPVVTNPKQAATTLKWMLCEMERRYELLAGVGARDIKRYNLMADAGDIGDGPSEDVVSADGRLPYIVVIIDELADLMAVAQASVEDAIMRLAQLSRAVGIHLLLATQRPSVDVITGVIKANFPYRISFQVSSKVDSRTVLDMNGAEKLLGKGDMLFLPPGRSTPIRAQGSLVLDSGIEKVVSFLREQQEPTYREDILTAETEAGHAGEQGAGGDELYEEAVAIILEIGHASVSMLQRRLSIGYSRSARLIDRMEEEGIIGGSRGSKPRQLLITGQGDRQSS